MSNALTAARDALSEALKDAGYRVVPEIPQTYSPPLCWVSPRQPYRQPGQTFASKRVSLAVICVAAQGTNAKALESVDELTSEVADLIDSLDEFRLDVEEIDVPQLYPSSNGQDFLGAAVNVTTDVARA